jgi:hypothetical protein
MCGDFVLLALSLNIGSGGPGIGKKRPHDNLRYIRHNSSLALADPKWPRICSKEAEGSVNSAYDRSTFYKERWKLLFFGLGSS